MSNDIRLVAIDLDDTLLRDDNTISAYTHEVLTKAQDAGYTVLIATGRMYQTAKPVGVRLGIGDIPMVLFSGGLIQRIESGEKVWEATIPEATAHKILGLAKEHNWYIQSYIDDVLYVHHETDFSHEYEEKTGATATYVGDQIYTQPGCPNKLLIIENPERLNGIQKELTAIMGDAVEIVRSKVNFLEINAPNTSKATAVDRMAQSLGLTAENVVAFGNSENDISMLRYASKGIAVANAEGPVKAVAAEECGSNEADGVAHWIEEHLLTK